MPSWTIGPFHRRESSSSRSLLRFFIICLSLWLSDGSGVHHHDHRAATAALAAPFPASAAALLNDAIEWNAERSQGAPIHVGWSLQLPLSPSNRTAVSNGLGCNNISQFISLFNGWGGDARDDDDAAAGSVQTPSSLDSSYVTGSARWLQGLPARRSVLTQRLAMLASLRSRGSAAGHPSDDRDFIRSVEWHDDEERHEFHAVLHDGLASRMGLQWLPVVVPQSMCASRRQVISWLLDAAIAVVAFATLGPTVMRRWAMRRCLGR